MAKVYILDEYDRLVQSLRAASTLEEVKAVIGKLLSLLPVERL